MTWGRPAFPPPRRIGVPTAIKSASAAATARQISGETQPSGSNVSSHGGFETRFIDGTLTRLQCFGFVISFIDANYVMTKV